MWTHINSTFRQIAEVPFINSLFHSNGSFIQWDYFHKRKGAFRRPEEFYLLADVLVFGTVDFVALAVASLTPPGETLEEEVLEPSVPVPVVGGVGALAVSMLCTESSMF